MKKTATTFLAILFSICAFSQNWLLTGNSGTNPTSNFVGTTDGQRLVFRTNNSEKMTILTSGSVGIGTNNPIKPFHIFSGSIDQDMVIQGPGPSFQLQTTISGVDQNGKLAFTSASGQYAATSSPGDLILINDDVSGNILFSTNVFAGNGLERMRIASNGNVGIGTTSTAPDARLQVECSNSSSPSNVRLTNLQSGTGTALVIDASGYVYRSASGLAASAASTPLTTDLQSQVEELKNQVQELRSLLSNRLSLTTAESNSLKSESATYLGDNFPNPASTSTTISYSLPAGVTAAACQVYTLDGKAITSLVLSPSAGKSQVQLNTGGLASGIYMYSLIVNGKVLDTKKLVISK